jgi:hypothetical protein
MKKRLYSFIYYRLLGWKTNVTVPNYDKCVICAAPHTSNWDLFIGKLFYGAIGRKTSFMMKKEWFFFPLGLIFRAIGGIPVDRSRNTSLVDQMANKFAGSKLFHLAITPEGTRKSNPNWKKGFYFIALKAQVPIMLIGIDYPTKTITSTKAIVKFLESNGIAKEEISIAPPEVIDMQAERYGNRDIAYRYNATSVITVTSKNVDKVRKLMSEQAELLKQGIAISGGDYRYNVVYEFTGLNDVKPQMIEEATKNARAAAEKFAKDSDSSLGKIRNASQGQFSISDRDVNTPYIKSIRVVTTVNYYLRR